MGLVAIADRVLSRTPLHGVARSMYHGAVDQRRIRRCYRRFVGPGDLALDVGANIGSRTRALLALGARVVAVEPQPHVAQTLRARVGPNPRFALVEKAIGSAEGTATLHVCSLSELSTLSAERAGECRRNPAFAHARWTSRPVPLTTLDAIISEHGTPVFTKIDVEGFEAEILRGLTHRIPALSFEVTPAHPRDALACLAEIARLGPAEFNFSPAETMALRFERWITPREAEAFCLQQLPLEPAYGDLYARFLQAP